jgi:hypothetical protein
MLIRSAILERIRTGDVTVAFRRWKRPTVRKGGTLRTGIGVLSIVDVVAVNEADIRDRDARRAGYANRDALFEDLRREGSVYRIELRYAGEDPRIALREDDDLDEFEFETICARLGRLDRASKDGPWTTAVMEAIRTNPHLPAVRLAEKTGYEKDWLKQNVRKLKNLGLTVSHHPGYTLSPRGKAVLDRFRTGRRG